VAHAARAKIRQSAGPPYPKVTSNVAMDGGADRVATCHVTCPSSIVRTSESVGDVRFELLRSSATRRQLCDAWDHDERDTGSSEQRPTEQNT
jgi:hypothetical protein